MTRAFRQIVRYLDVFTATPLATLLAFGLTLGWVGLGPHLRFSAGWQLLMTTTSAVVTFLMVFVLASAQKRNTDALHLKIDMLVAAHPELTNKAVGVEQAPPEHVRIVREELAAKMAEMDAQFEARET